MRSAHIVWPLSRALRMRGISQSVVLQAQRSATSSSGLVSCRPYTCSASSHQRAASCNHLLGKHGALPRNPSCSPRVHHLEQQPHCGVSSLTKRHDSAETEAEEVGWRVVPGVIQSAELVHLPDAGRCVQIRWKDGTESLYPFVWLRDNCQCPECFLAYPTYVRSLVLSDLNLNCLVEDCVPSEDGATLEIRWDDGHLSSYRAAWLLARSFRPAEQKRRQAEKHEPRWLWEAADLESAVPHANFRQVMEDELTRLNTLLALERYGLVILNNCGYDGGQVMQLACTLGGVYATHYGDIFDVESKPNPVNIAYTTKRLNMHADLPYYRQQPEVQFLHYRRQHTGGGGKSEFTDAVLVANHLRDQDPGAFRMLADTPVDWVNVSLSFETGNSHHKIHQAPVLDVDSEDEVQSIRFSQAQRDSHFGVPLNKVERWYRAFSLFNRMLNLPKYKISFLPNEGDMIMFDNTRLVHGREDFASPEDAERRTLQGGYVSLDVVRDHRRVLQHRLGDNPYGL